MLPRIRKTDLIGLVGLTLLLVWTPAYYAQDPVEQGLTGGTSFTLPSPRDGDRVLLELQISERGGPVVSYGPILELSFQALDADTPTGGRFAFTKSHPALSLETDLVRYSQQARTHSLHLDAQGRALYTTESDVKEEESGDALVLVHDLRGRTATHCDGSFPHAFSGQTFHFDPETVGIYLHHARQGLFDRDDPMDHCGPSAGNMGAGTLNRAAEAAGHLLFGRHALREDRVLEPYLSHGSALDTCTIEAEEPLIRHHGDNDHWGPIYMLSYDLDEVVSKDALEYSCDIRRPEEAWHWISPAFPYPVGVHREIFDADGAPLLRIDLVPTHIERGEGSPFKLAEPSNILVPRDVSVAGGPSDVPQPRLPTLPLRDLEAQETAFVHGLTYADLRQALEDHAAPPVVSFLKDAQLVSFFWRANGPEMMTADDVDPAPFPLPTWPVNQPANRTHLPSYWQVTYANEEGTAIACSITFSIEDRPAGKRSSVLDGCSDGPTGSRSYALDWDRPLVPPSALFADLPPTDPLTGGLLDPPVDTKSSFTWSGVPRESHASFEVWHIPPSGDERHIIAGTYDLGTGYQTSTWSRTIEYRPLDPPPSHSGMSATAPSMIDPLAHHIALGGLLLLLVSFLARLTSSLKTGTMTAAAAALYAKIHKDRVLDHERRDAILTLIRQDPGLTLREVQSALGYGWGSTVHHVETMIRNGLLVDLRVHRKRHLFVAEAPLQERRRVVAERDPQLLAVMEAIRAHPGLSQRELLQHVSDSESGLSRIGARLAALGLVERRRSGRTVRLYPKA